MNDIPKKKIYIAGKVSDLPEDEVEVKFAKAQQKLEAKGYEVVNPVTLVKDSTTPWIPAMKICIPALCECDAIYLLPDWKNSKGARLENNIAQHFELMTLTKI